MKNLTDPVKIVEVLGGPQKVAEMTEAKNTKAVWNWHGYFEAFPPNTYAIMIEALERCGYTAPPYLWKMRGYERRAKKKRAA
jgi:hypothetical protein